MKHNATPPSATVAGVSSGFPLSASNAILPAPIAVSAVSANGNSTAVRRLSASCFVS